jgi:ParB/RepB/Spo0J family partition protein
MKDVSGKDIDFSANSSESEFNNDSDRDWSSMLDSSQPLPLNITIITLSIDSVKTNPEYQQIAPQMSQNELQGLTESIRQHGLYLPIVVNNDYFLLDGHHRYKACRELKIKEIPVLVLSFNDNLKEKLFICESAGKRRNLSEYAKAELATLGGTKAEE